MKKIVLFSVFGLMLATACSNQKRAESAESESAQSETADTVTVGHFETNDFDGYRLHVYFTDDTMGDASFIIEGNDSLVTLEQPLFKANAEVFDSYLAALGKPVAKRIADFHLGNTGSDTIVMPQGMPEVVKGPQYSGMMNHFAQEYGDAIVPLPTGPAEEVAFDQTVVFAGVPFTFYKGASNDFPGANILIGKDVVYSHWAPTKSHINNLYAGSIQDVDSRLAELEQILSTGATLFVGGHGMLASADDVKFRIEYLCKIKQYKSENSDAKSFAEALIAAYPNLPGEDGVTVLAEAMYSNN